MRPMSGVPACRRVFPRTDSGRGWHCCRQSRVPSRSPPAAKPARFHGVATTPGGHPSGRSAPAQASPDVRQHVVLGQPIHLDAAARRKMGKVEPRPGSQSGAVLRCLRRDAARHCLVLASQFRLQVPGSADQPGLDQSIQSPDPDPGCQFVGGVSGADQGQLVESQEFQCHPAGGRHPG